MLKNCNFELRLSALTTQEVQQIIDILEDPNMSYRQQLDVLTTLSQPTLEEKVEGYINSYRNFNG